MLGPPFKDAKGLDGAVRWHPHCAEGKRNRFLLLTQEAPRQDDAMSDQKHEAGRAEVSSEEVEPGRRSDDRPIAVVRWLEAAKRHPVVVIAVSIVAVLTFATTAWALARDTASLVGDIANPHGALYEQLEQLRLDVTPDYLDRALGPPTSTLTPEADCPACGTLSLRLYEIEEDVVVRALFEEGALRMYLVTRVNPDVRPLIRWQEVEPGRLGEASFAEASDLTGDGLLIPTDVAFWPGAQRINYLEVFALGSPGNYEGLILGHSSAGVSDSPFDMTDAQTVADAYMQTVHTLPPDAVHFRQESRPNTFGTYRDDGPVAALIRDADFAASIQIAGTFE